MATPTPLGILSYLEHLDAKKNSLQKAILMLAVEWKDLDEHLDSTKECFDESLIDLESKHKNLELNRESVIESNRELDLVRKSLDSRLEELKRREDMFCALNEATIKEFKMKEEQLGAMRIKIEERMEEVESREERLYEQKKSIEALLAKIETEKREFDGIEKSIGAKLDEIRSKEQSLEDRAKELDSKGEQVELREVEVKAAEKMNKQRAEELRIKASEIDSAKKLNEEQSKELCSKEERMRWVEKTAKKYNDLSAEIFFREKELLELSKENLLKRKVSNDVVRSLFEVKKVKDIRNEETLAESSLDFRAGNLQASTNSGATNAFPESSHVHKNNFTSEFSVDRNRFQNGPFGNLLAFRSAFDTGDAKMLLGRGAEML